MNYNNVYSTNSTNMRPGSNKPPIQASSQTPVRTDQSVCNSSANPANGVLSDDATQPSPIWSPTYSTVIKDIPKSARPFCASHLAALLRKVVSNPDSTPKWLDLFNWGHAVLHTPKRGGKRRNLATAIKHRIASYSVGQPDSDSANPTHNARRQLSSTSTISQAVSAKLEDRNVRAAIRLLKSEDSPAAPSPQSLSTLREKHPPSSSVFTHLPAPQPQQCLSVDEAASTLSLHSDILADCASSDNTYLHSYLSTWSMQFGDVPEVLLAKQPFWVRPGLLVDKAQVEATLNSPHSRTSFLAACSQHSGDWLFALPIASCGLKMDDEAVRVAVGLRLG